MFGDAFADSCFALSELALPLTVLSFFWREHGFCLNEEVRLAFMGDADVVGEDKAQGQAA